MREAKVLQELVPSPKLFPAVVAVVALRVVLPLDVPDQVLAPGRLVAAGLAPVRPAGIADDKGVDAAVGPCKTGERGFL